VGKEKFDMHDIRCPECGAKLVFMGRASTDVSMYACDNCFCDWVIEDNEDGDPEIRRKFWG